MHGSKRSKIWRLPFFIPPSSHPTSSSTLYQVVSWGNVLLHVWHSLDTSIYRDHAAIPSYRLQRSHLPLNRFQIVCSEQLAISRNIGQMNDLETKATKKMYMNSIPSTLLSLFSRPVINLAEHALNWRITASGRRDFWVTLLGLVMLFIQDKNSLKESRGKHSNLVSAGSHRSGRRRSY